MAVDIALPIKQRHTTNFNEKARQRRESQTMKHRNAVARGLRKAEKKRRRRRRNK